MEKVIIMIPVLVVIGGLGIVIGMYISSQIENHIERKIRNEQKKRKN